MQPFLRLVRVLGVCSLVLIVAGCDSSSSDGSGSAGSGAGGGAGNGAGGSGGSAAGGKDLCQSTEDLGWLKSKLASGQTGRELAREKAGDCGLGCLNDAAPDKCAIDCMKKEGVQLTDGCAGCYGGIVLCTIENCLPKCIDDPQAQICKDCQVEKGCDGTFYTCTGPLD